MAERAMEPGREESPALPDIPPAGSRMIFNRNPAPMICNCPLNLTMIPGYH